MLILSLSLYHWFLLLQLGLFFYLISVSHKRPLWLIKRYSCLKSLVDPPLWLIADWLCYFKSSCLWRLLLDSRFGWHHVVIQVIWVIYDGCQTTWCTFTPIQLLQGLFVFRQIQGIAFLFSAYFGNDFCKARSRLIAIAQVGKRAVEFLLIFVIF